MAEETDNGRVLVIFSFTRAGSEKNAALQHMLAEKGMVCKGFATDTYAGLFALETQPMDVKQWVGDHWGTVDFLFIGAAGIAVRYIAPWVVDKYTDSAVLSMDEKGEYVIPLLSGHVGGAVELAKVIAAHIGGTAVISTATDIQNKFAVDVFAKTNKLVLSDRELAKYISASILDGKQVGVYSDFPLQEKFPDELQLCFSLDKLYSFEFSIYLSKQKISLSAEQKQNRVLLLYPEEGQRDIVVGIGCRRGVAAEKLDRQLEVILKAYDLDVDRIRLFASIDLKKREQGILELSKKYNIPFVTYSAEELEKTDVASPGSDFVKQVTGVDNVCERAARKASPSGRWLQTKVKMDGVTFAILQEEKAIHFSGIALG